MRLYGGIQQCVPLVWNELFESRRLFVVEMNQNVRQTHGIELDFEHLFESGRRRQAEDGRDCARHIGALADHACQAGSDTRASRAGEPQPACKKNDCSG